MIELNTKTFDETINGNQPVIVDFWAEWCMPCKIFAPVIEEISDELDGKAQFCKVNIDDNPTLAQKYDISMIPTVVIFKDGEPMDRMVGVLPKNQVLETVSKHL